MSQFIDRRKNHKNKSAVNRQRFIRRFKKQIKHAVTEAINTRSITDIYSGEKIVIPKKDITEPIFQHGHGGVLERIFPGNKEFVPGDKIKRPESAPTGSGSNASNEGEGIDDFVFELTKEEFVDIFFEDLELPDLVKTKLTEIKTKHTEKAGFTTVGSPTNINILRTFRNALGRRIAFSGQDRRSIQQLEEEIAALLKDKQANDDQVLALQEKLAALKQKIAKVPFLDPYDVRYSNKVVREQPTSQAVMFCIMDVSGSMDATKKDIAKRFFILLYVFLTKTYEKIDIVFIRHHTTAKVVDEHEFFYSRETGGTVVSSALETMRTVIETSYPTENWNIYCAQASDGDNWNADSPHCQQILMEDIMPLVQYYAYVEILPRHHQSLWRSYQAVKDAYQNFNMKNISNVQEIYSVLHKLFKRKIDAN